MYGYVHVYAEEGITCPGAGVTGSGEPVCGCWEPGSLEEPFMFPYSTGGLEVSPTGRRDAVSSPPPGYVKGCGYLRTDEGFQLSIFSNTHYLPAGDG